MVTKKKSEGRMMYLVVAYCYIENYYYTENKLAIFTQEEDALDYACEYFKREWRKRASSYTLHYKYHFEFPFNKPDSPFDGIKVYRFNNTFLFEEVWTKEIEVHHSNFSS